MIIKIDNDAEFVEAASLLTAVSTDENADKGAITVEPSDLEKAEKQLQAAGIGYTVDDEADLADEDEDEEDEDEDEDESEDDEDALV